MLPTLQRQEEVVDQQELKAKVDNDKWQDRLKGYEDKIGEMALHIRTRDKRILAVENKVRPDELRGCRREQHSFWTGTSAAEETGTSSCRPRSRIPPQNSLTHDIRDTNQDTNQGRIRGHSRKHP